MAAMYQWRAQSPGMINCCQVSPALHSNARSWGLDSATDVLQLQAAMCSQILLLHSPLPFCKVGMRLK